MIISAVNLGGANGDRDNGIVRSQILIYWLLISIYIDYKLLHLLDYKLITKQERRESIQIMIQRFWV